jgi:hypothetical protein
VTDSNPISESAEEWTKAKNIIATALDDIRTSGDTDFVRSARIIIARLAKADMLIVHSRNVKDK